MASWPTGVEAIKALVAGGNLQNVAPSLDLREGSSPELQHNSDCDLR